MAVIRKPSKHQIVSYIDATLTRGENKIEAYKKHINPNIRSASSAIKRFEQSPDYIALMESLSIDNDQQLNIKVAKVRSKYVNLIEKNIDAMGDIIDSTEGMEINEKAKAVRLANETITAMQIVDGPKEPGNPAGKLNRGGAVMS